ncbi:MAG: hypothetical protein JWP89_1151 [Schlesneria sp.]|nr:hypothetical protein [Schlesneria sp.]
MKPWKLLIVLVGVIGVHGCGPTTCQVNGKVNFEDGSPLTFGRVTFAPKAGSKGFWAPLTNDGTFAVDPAMEAQAGDYTVTLVGAEEPAFFETDPTTGVNKLLEPPKPLIDAKYASGTSSGLNATIKPGKNELSFKVDKLP